MNLLILRAFIFKELRTMLRERYQFMGIIVSIIVLASILASVGYQASQASRQSRVVVTPIESMPAAPQTAPTTGLSTAPAATGATPPGETEDWTPPKLAAMRWVFIMGAVGVALLFSMGYLMTAVITSFAGEKEARTMEILLSAPIGDSALFFTKCLSVLIPMVIIGYILLLVPALAGMIMLHSELSHIPIHVGFYALVLSVPPLLLVQAAIVGIGAAISAKSETVKGASQTLGVLFVVLFFGLGYGLPLLFRYTALRAPAIAFVKSSIVLPFAVQYLIMLAVLLIPVVFSFAAGRALFQRDRLLT